MTVRDRIQRLYEAHPRGAAANGTRTGPQGKGQIWLARESERILGQPVDPSTVRRWCIADRLSRLGTVLVEQLESEIPRQS